MNIKISRFVVYFFIGALAVLVNMGFVGFDLRSRADEIPADIHIQTQSVGAPLPKDFYHAFAQGGEERGDMIAPSISQVKALKPKLIRIDHIFDHFPVVTRVNGTLQFDFSSLDRAVDSILATSATPMLVLSYMPGAIAKDSVITNIPVNWAEWALVVQKTIERYSGNSGKSIPGVYYELWNEPDLPQFGSFRTYGQKNYLSLYHYAAVGASQAINVLPFFIGGPSTSALYKNWITEFAQTHDRIDFISWHRYDGDPTKITEDIKLYKSWSNLPILITESGFDSALDPRYGTMYAAAYTAATIRQLIDNPPSYFFTFELKDGPIIQNGWGLMTHESNGLRLKPRYHVFSFLDALVGGRLSVTGESPRVSTLATSDNGKIQVILINYFEDRDRSQSVPVTFDGLTPGAYSLRQKYFLGQDTTLRENITTSSLTKTIYLPANGILLLELQPVVNQ